MTMSWVDAAERDGPQRAAKLEAGVHDVEITRIVFAGKDGQTFQSKRGDPQIMLIFADNAGHEASEMFTLSETAMFNLAKVLSRSGANLRAMDADGVKPQDFAEPDFANANLVGRRLRIEVSYEEGSDKKMYARCEPLKREGSTPAGQGGKPPVKKYGDLPI